MTPEARERLEAMFRRHPKPEAAIPYHYAKTYPELNVTEEDVHAIQAAEMADRLRRLQEAEGD